jgi:hypothetical protein
VQTLEGRLTAASETSRQAPSPGHEFVRGWGVFALPFDSGHVLALRVFPEGTFAPYRSLWHRDPLGRWAIYTDAAQPELACPRYFGPACTHLGRARIDLTWTGPDTLRVEVDQPSLVWELTARTTPAFRLANAASAAVPTSTWRSARLVRMRERMARALGLGSLQLIGTTPSGHIGTLMPEHMYLVDRAHAYLEGHDLGQPARLDRNPTIGGVPLPARGVLAQGQAMWRVLDEGEGA